MNREERMEWCKKRALQYVDIGDIPQAITSMLSDLGSHPETINHPGIELGFMLLMAGQLKTQEEARRFINGFN